MISLLIIPAILVVLIVAVISFLAGRARGYAEGWDANTSWQRSVTERGLGAKEIVPMARMQTRAIPFTSAKGGSRE